MTEKGFKVALNIINVSPEMKIKSGTNEKPKVRVVMVSNLTTCCIADSVIKSFSSTRTSNVAIEFL